MFYFSPKFPDWNSLKKYIYRYWHAELEKYLLLNQNMLWAKFLTNRYCSVVCFSNISFPACRLILRFYLWHLLSKLRHVIISFYCLLNLCNYRNFGCQSNFNSAIEDPEWIHDQKLYCLFKNTVTIMGFGHLGSICFSDSHRQPELFFGSRNFGSFTAGFLHCCKCVLPILASIVIRIEKQSVCFEQRWYLLQRWIKRTALSQFFPHERNTCKKKKKKKWLQFLLSTI